MTLQQAARFDPNDSKVVFEGTPTQELVRAAAIFELCARPALIKPGTCTLCGSTAAIACGLVARPSPVMHSLTRRPMDG